MNWSEQLYHYCERAADASLWAEPLNLVSNLAFIIAAVVSLKRYQSWRKESGRQSPAMQLLIVLMFIVGIGSALFHSVATRWAMMADVIPILLLMYIYQGMFVRKVMHFSGWQVVLYLGVFYVVSQSMGAIFGEEALNGSVFYLPILLAFFVFGGWMKAKNKDGAEDMIMAALIFIVSLTFRTIDMYLCHTLPCGTHFMWHLLNGGVLYFLFKGLLPHMGGVQRPST